MNKWIYFAGGVFIGGLIGYFTGKKVSEKRANEKLEEMREYYKCRSCYSTDSKRPDQLDEQDEQKEDQEADSNDHTTPRTDYTKYYKPGSVKHDGKEKEIEFEDGCDPEAEYEEEEIDEDDLAAEEIEEEAEERRKNANRRPKIISEEAVGELPPYVTMQLLYYYPETDVMTDEDDRLVGEEGEYGYLVGDCIEKYGFGDENNTEKVIFVRNYDLDVCYEIQKMPGNDPITEAALE